MTLPRGWALAPLSSLFASITDGDHLPPPQTPEGVPFLVIGDVRSGRIDFSDTRYVSRSYYESLSESRRPRRNDILYTVTGSFGIPVLVDTDRPFCVQRHMAILRPEDGISAALFSRFLGAPAIFEQATGVATGTAQKTVPLKGLRGFQIPVPPPTEQHRIAEALDSYLTRLDDTVATLERVQRNLKRYRASVLKAAVEGRLVPTEAELARAEKRDYEPASELLERILAERRRRWNGRGKYEEPAAPDTSNLPELPEGWCWASVDQVSRDVRYGTSARCSEDVSEGVPVLRMGNIADGKLNLDKLKYLPVDHDEFPDLLLEPGDLLFNRTNSAELVGKTAVYHGRPHACSFASYLIRVRFIPGAEAEFVAANLNSPRARRWIASVAVQQVGQANVNGTKLKAYTFPLPPLAEQLRIVEEMNRVFSVLEESTMSVDANRKRSDRLRQSILKWAFEGKLVDQDPNDEPASSLLERIRAKKTAST